MKSFLALGPRQNLSPETAWGCLTANLAAPGAGSLAAGRLSGYPQLLVAFAGFAMTMSFGTRFVVWFVKNYARLRDMQLDDPVMHLMEVWIAARWALLGIAVFAVAWLWALATGFAIVRRARQTAGRLPPHLPL